MNKLEIGNVVYSVAGRDRGRYFVVVGLEDGYVYVADGSLRKLDHPKKKKIKHIKVKPQKVSVSETQLMAKQILDSDIRKSLESMGYGIQKEG